MIKYKPKIGIDALYFKTRPAKAISRLFTELVFEGRQFPARWMWTNKINSTLLNMAIWLPQVRQVHEPIFILGMGRSGTTILSKVLSLHPDVSLLNEPKLIWHLAYHFEDLAGNYTNDIAKYRLGEEEVNDNINKAMHRMYGFILKCTGSTRVVDKYPELIFRVPFVKSIFADAKFIFINRNGFDTIQSVCRWTQEYAKVAENGDTYDWWGLNNRKWQLLVDQLVIPNPIFTKHYRDIMKFKRLEDKVAVEWIATMNQGLQLTQEFPDQVYEIQYDDLVNEPEREITSILDFCHLTKDELLISYASKILAGVSYNSKIELDTSIQSLFEETMNLSRFHSENFDR